MNPLIRSILDICTEARHWESLEFDIPTHIKSLYLKYENVQYVYESVMTVVIDYNRIISSLSDRERLLFKQLINACDKKITPGLFKLTWNDDVCDTYIADCVTHTGEVYLIKFYLINCNN